LDFYLHNVRLSADGFKVQMTINQSEKYLITDWKPFALQGLPEGENVIKLELLNKKGLRVNPEVNTIIREFTVKK